MDESPSGYPVESDWLFAHTCLASGGSQPPAGESGPPRRRDVVGAAAHNAPNQAGAVVLRGQDDRALADAKVVCRDPPAGRAVRVVKGVVKRQLEPLWPVHAYVQPGQVAGGMTISGAELLSGFWPNENEASSRR